MRPHKCKSEEEALVSMLPNLLPSKPKSRKYGEEYLAFGFTCTTVGDERKIIYSYLKQANLKWEDCVDIYTEGVQAMAGN